MFNLFKPFDMLTINSNGIVAYNPLINYDWSTTTTSGLRYLKDVGSTPTYNASMYFGRGAYLNGVDQTITVPINTTIQTSLKRVNGVVTINETSQTLTNYVISGLGVHKDYYLFTRLLRTSEKDSYINTPELFYAMAQADSTCVLNMPMCETDGYVRNMKSYSEGDNFSGNTLEYLTAGTGNSIIQTTNIFNITNTVSTGQTYLPYVKFSPTVFTSDLYYQEIEVVCLSGTLQVNSMEGLPKNTILEVLVAGQTKTYTRVSQLADIGGQKGVLTFNGLGYPTFTARVTIKNIRKIIDGAYQIQNYTSSVRDNAKNLQYGLQTCKFVRDNLGVIQSASDYLECDGGGYADTGWIPSNSVYIEAILYMPKDGSSGKFGSNAGHSFEVQNNNNFLYYSPTNRAYSLSYIAGYVHVYVEVDAVGVVDMTLNGYVIASKTAVVKPFTNETFYLGKQHANGDVSWDNEIRLFKVHTEPQDPLELYNKAVSKGLLS